MKITTNYSLYKNTTTFGLKLNPQTNSNKDNNDKINLSSHTPTTKTSNLTNKLFSFVKNLFAPKPPEIYDEITPIEKWIPKTTKQHPVQLQQQVVPSDRIEKQKTVYSYTPKITKNKDKLKANILITAKHQGGDYIFDNPYTIYHIVHNKDLTAQDLQKAINIFSNNPQKLDEASVAHILGYLNTANIDLLEGLLMPSNPSNICRYKQAFWTLLLQQTNTINNKAALELFKATDEQGEQRFSNSNIETILRYLNKDNIDAFPHLLNAKNTNGKYKINGYAWAVLEYINKENIDAVPYMLNSLCKINGKTKHTLNYDEFRTLIKCVNKNNIKTVPLLITKLSQFKTTNNSPIEDTYIAERILMNVTNDMAKVLPEILEIKNPTNKNEYLFNKHKYYCHIHDVAKAFLDSELKPIAKDLLQKKAYPWMINTYNTAEGIHELAKMIKEKKYRMERLYLKFHLDGLLIPMYRNPKEIVELAKALADPNRKEITKKLMHFKNKLQSSRLGNFHENNVLNRINNNINFDIIKTLAEIDDKYGDKTFSLSEILDILEKYKYNKISQIPIPQKLQNSYSAKHYIEKNISFIDDWKNDKLDINSLDSSDKLDLKSYISALEDYPLSKKSEYDIDIQSLKQEIHKSINQTITPTKVEKENKINLFKNIFSNNSETENILTSFDYAKYGKQGLPIEYTREMFLFDLKKILSTIAVEQKNIILKKLQIEVDDNFKTYNGIINLYDLDKTNTTEKQVYNICENFILKNKIKTNNSVFNNTMNALIKGMPEFINVIGKQPHGAHNYSIDIHMLEVLKQCLQDPQYKTLSPIEKTKLKITAILHDIAKKEGVVDKKHQETSALYARNILAKYNLPQSIKNDIFFLVQNHHWLEEINNNIKSINEIACAFRNPNDYTLSKILTLADLKSVSTDIYNTFSPQLDNDKQKELINSIKAISQTGNILFTTKIINENKLPTEKYKGYNYKVVNLPKIKANSDLGAIGFAPGTQKADLRFLIHSVNNAEALRRVEDLSDISQNIVLSLSYISPTKARLYSYNEFGVGVDVNIPDITNAYYKNQASGTSKDKNKLIALKTDERELSYRNYLPKQIKESLGINTNEYNNLYNQIALKKHLTQIDDNDIFRLSKNKNKYGEEIKNAIKLAEDKLLSKTDHNEVVGAYVKVNSFIAKCNTISEIPQDYLNFVQQYNLPIILLGKNC